MARVHKAAAVQIAKSDGVQRLLDVHAQELVRKARANAQPAAQTGKYSDAFSVEVVKGRRGVKDRLVVNEHPASSAIELGHFAENSDGTTGEYVPGRFDLVRALYQ